MNSPSARFKMIRQHSQRYSRVNLGKGLKVKHVLQIVIVVVVLTWVSYELNLTVKPASTTGISAFQDPEQASFLGRKALKPEGGPGKFGLEVEKDVPTDVDDTVSKSSQEENFDGSRTEEDSDDQRDRDLSVLDIEHATDQDEKSEDEAMTNDVVDVRHDVGSDFEELKNEQARVEQEESGENGKDGKDGDVDEGRDSQSQDNEATTSDDASTDGGFDDDNHLSSAVDKEKKARETATATFMDAFNADSILKPKLDKLDEGETANTSRANLDEKRDLATDSLKETSEDSGEEVAEEKIANQNEEEENAEDLDKDVGDEIVDTAEDSNVLDTAEDNVNNQSVVVGTQRNLDAERSDADREKTEESVEAHEESKVDDTVEMQEQRQEPERDEAVKEEIQSQRSVEEEEKLEERTDAQSHVQEQEEKKQEEGVEKKVDDTQTEQEAEVKNTESNIQPELKTEGADVDVEKKADETQASEGKSNRYVQPEEVDNLVGLDGSQDRLAAEKSIQSFQGTSAEEKEEAGEDHNSGETQNDSERQQDNTEQKKNESLETNSAKYQETQVETDSKNSEGSSDSSDSEVEKNSQEDNSAETVNADASKLENSKQEGKSSKDEALKQGTDSNAAGSGESKTKIEDQSAEEFTSLIKS